MHRKFLADNLSPLELLDAFQRVDTGLATDPDGRKRAEGPIANVIRAAHTVGWHFINPTRICFIFSQEMETISGY